MSDQPSRRGSPGPLKLRLFNPHRLSDADLERSFIARQGTFRSILGDILGEPPDGRPQHHLIVGQRGMGKTTLLRRLAVELRRDPQRARFIPLSFPEEQHIGIDRLSKFWLNCLDALADEIEAEGGTGGTVAAIDAAVEEVEEQLRDEKVAEPLAREAFTSAWRRLGRRPVLFIDNFNLLLNRLKDHDYALRGYFSDHGAPILVAACTDVSDRLEDYGAAFYDGFKHHLLRPLTLEEMREVIERLAQAAGRQDVLNRLSSEMPRLAALRDLTGGNPRTAVLLFDLFARGFSEDAYEDLDSLLDIITPLYQSRLEQLAEQAQVIVAALARRWAPMTAGELCDATGLANSSVSPQLGRLKDLGLVEEAPVFPSKRTGYQIAERFFNVWYLMRFATRRQRASLTSLTRFLETFHTPAERAVAARRLLGETSLRCEKVAYAMAVADSLSAEPALAHELTVKAQLDLIEQMKGVRERIAEILDPSDIDRRFYAFAELKERLRQAVPADASLTGREFADLVLGSPALLSGEIGGTGARSTIANAGLTRERITEMEDQLRKEVNSLRKRYGEEAVAWLRYRLQHGLITALDNADEISESVLTADGVAKVRLLLDFAAPAAKRNLRDDAFERISDYLKPDSASKAESWFDWAYRMHTEFDRYAEAEAAYRKAIELDPKDADPWNNLGNLLQDHLGRYPEVEVAYRKAIELDPKNAVPWYNLGNLLKNHPGRHPEAEVAYRKAIELDPKDADPWNNLGNLLQDHLGRYPEAEAAYRKAIELDPNYAFPWNGLGNLLKNHLGRYPEAEAAYREAIELDPKTALPWNNLGNLLQDHLGRYPEAEAAYRKAIELDPNYAFPWNGLGSLLQDHLGRYPEAEAAYRKAIELDPKTAVPWNNLGNLLKNHLGRYAEAEAAYRKAIELDPKSAVPWYNLGNLLQDHPGRYPEAEAAYRKAIELDPKSAVPWNNLGNLLKNHLGRYPEAEAAYRKAIELDPKRAIPWTGLGNLLADYFGRFDDARAAFEKALQLDPAEDSPRHNLAFLLRDFLHDPDAARESLAGCQESEKGKDTRALHEALFAAYADNWGVTATALREALQVTGFTLPPSTRDDWFRASAVLLHLGFGEKLVALLEAEGADVRMLPWFAAVRAHALGDRRHLLNVAVEARPAAETIYDEIQKRRARLDSAPPARTSRG